MNVLSIKDYKNRQIVNRLLEIPFFMDLHKFSLKEFNVLLDNSSVLNLEKGEVLLDHGQSTKYFYVLIEGELDVFQAEPEDKAIGKIKGAQIFGALGAINHEPRTATIAASRSAPAQVLAVNFNIFGRLEDFSNISIYTKVSLYSIVVNNIRCKLKSIQKENGQYQLPATKDSELTSKYRKNSLAQLRVLALQTHRLGQILESSNQQLVPSIDLPRLAAESRFMTNIKALFNRRALNKVS